MDYKKYLKRVEPTVPDYFEKIQARALAAEHEAKRGNFDGAHAWMTEAYRLCGDIDDFDIRVRVLQTLEQCDVLISRAIRERKRKNAHN